MVHRENIDGSQGLSFLALAVASSDSYLPTPQATYELVYELTRNSGILEKQRALIESSGSKSYAPTSDTSPLRYLLGVSSFYNEKLSGAGALDASRALKAIIREIESDGLHQPFSYQYREPP